MLQIGPGTVVLNQNPSDPMSGTVIDPADTNKGLILGRDSCLVRWCNGQECIEQLTDVTLTGKIVLIDINCLPYYKAEDHE